MELCKVNAMGNSQEGHPGNAKSSNLERGAVVSLRLLGYKCNGSIACVQTLQCGGAKRRGKLHVGSFLQGAYLFFSL